MTNTELELIITNNPIYQLATTQDPSILDDTERLAELRMECVGDYVYNTENPDADVVAHYDRSR